MDEIPLTSQRRQVKLESEENKTYCLRCYGHLQNAGIFYIDDYTCVYDH